jgi:glycosyltransferase involved in cell wall biosynthesis
LEEYFNILPNKIIVINNGVAQDKEFISRIKLEEYTTKFSGKKIILCFGVISPRKGQSNAVRAFKIIEDKIPDYVLIIAGRPITEFNSYKENLLQNINELNLQKKVFYFGYLNNEEINVLFEIADMTLWPYHPAIYGSGAFSFALQYNKPSIVTSIDTFKEILGDEGALFVDPMDDNQLAQAILNLTTDFKMREKLTSKMRIVLKSRSCNDVAQKHLDIYEKI